MAEQSNIAYLERVERHREQLARKRWRSFQPDLTDFAPLPQQVNERERGQA